MKIEQPFPSATSQATTMDRMPGSWRADVAQPRTATVQAPVVERLREPTPDDGADIWALVKDTRVLDLNSPYSYLMLGEYFPETCVVAERRDRLIGFVSAFLPPRDDGTVFVWQVAVARSAGRRGLAKSMLRELLKRPACDDVRYLEATVTPSNRPSAALFCALARDLDSPCVVTEGFPSEAFPGESHETERRFRIGPFC
jgi:L-2,4-diaminobutyric acid acetyltransferase